MLMRCAFTMKVTANGKTRSELISVKEADMRKFVEALQPRAPEAEVKLISLT